MTRPILVRKSQYVSVAHRYWDERWSDAENRRHYGRLASRDGLGSNMRIELGKFEAKASELDAAAVQAKQLLDHRCLFTEVAEFKTQSSSLERVCAYLQAQLPPLDLIRVEENSKVACQLDGQGLTLEVQVMNLRLYFHGRPGENGLIVDREKVTQAVIDEYGNDPLSEALSSAEWARSLYEKLGRRLPLNRLRIDLGRQKYILVNSNG
jgi:hypothetical protein